MDIPVKVFKVAVTAMNGFLPKGEKIKTLKAKKEDILKQFEDVILAKIADGSAGDLPEECIDMYNEYLASAEEEEEEVDDVEEEEEEVVEKKTKGKKTTTKKTTPTKKTTTKKTTPTKKSTPAKKTNGVGVDVYGARNGSGTAKINEMLVNGATIEQIAEEVGSPKSRVSSHLTSLKKKDIVVNKDSKGVLKFK
jgi:hypothetical protein